ncbi:MAG TPA: hypothetical protein VKZ63_08590 [Kofleriaceae bacterium]|nr:hypothetical protein [Kofleriaceae bacterium]
MIPRFSLGWRAGGVALLAAAFACGGSKQSATGGGVGESSNDLDTAGGPAAGAADAGAVEADAAPPPAPVTFVLKNSHTEELSFSLNKGWQPNFIAFSGQPPKAKSILLFPTHCTASCDATDEERCPVCEAPETAKEELEAQKFETVAPGASIEVPWDGKVFVYEKTRGLQNGKKKRCQCYRQVDPEPGTYTVRAVGLRLTKEVGTNTRNQIVEAQMTLPVTEPVRIELDFGAPATPGGKKKKKR